LTALGDQPSAEWIGCVPGNFIHGRPLSLKPEAIVIHIMDGSFASGESVFADPTSHKSAHYGISREGIIHQYVSEDDTAFHAGIVVNPTWKLLKPRVNPNFYTIGIEHEGRAADVWPEAQLSASASLMAGIAERWKIPVDTDHVIRHHEIRSSKTCPGIWLTDMRILMPSTSLSNITV
jgi:N-acetylmuramoyl-L-alanine amidase